MSCSIPRTVPEACPPMGNDEALRMEGFFAACGLPSVPESCPRGELPHGSVTSACLMEQRSKACRDFSTASASLPDILKPEHHGPHVR